MFDRKFADMFSKDEHGHRVLDLGPIHDTVPLAEPAVASATPPA